MRHTDFAPIRLLPRLALAAGLLAAPWAPAWAVVKCVAPDGRVTFQDIGCDVHSTAQPLIKRFGQLSTEEPVPRAPRQARDAAPAARGGERQGGPANRATVHLGQAAVPGWR